MSEEPAIEGPAIEATCLLEAFGEGRSEVEVEGSRASLSRAKHTRQCRPEAPLMRVSARQEGRKSRPAPSETSRPRSSPAAIASASTGSGIAGNGPCMQLEARRVPPAPAGAKSRSASPAGAPPASGRRDGGEGGGRRAEGGDHRRAIAA